MRVLVTGHKGFIGSHLFRTLLEKGYDVLGWDLKDGNDCTRMVSADLYDGRPNRRVDVIFHLAAMPRVPLSIERPGYTNWHNVEGTLRVLWAAKEAGVKRVVYSSSSSVYGEQKMPLKETMFPSPMSPYAVQKLTGEYYCKVFTEVYGLETVSLRYFNVFGEGMKADDPYSPCIAIFLEQKRKKQPLTIFGGEQRRDFTYVGDVVEANLLAMNSEKVGKGEIVNIGGGRNYSINEIASFVSDNTVHLPQRKGEPMSTLADIKKAKNLLGWSPTVNLKDWLTEQGA